MVGYGTVVPEGHLPVYSVDTEEEARQLITLACETNLYKQHIAKELAVEQTIENLGAFGERLARTHQWMLERKAERDATPQRKEPIVAKQVIVDDRTGKAVIFEGTTKQAIKAWRAGETKLMGKTEKAHRSLVLGTNSVEAYEEQFIQVRKLIG